MRLGLALSSAFLFACATSSSAGKRFEPKEIPKDLVADVERAKKLGRAIWENDIVSARATDVMVEAKVLPDAPFHGWVTSQGADGAYVVDFVTGLAGGSLAATHEVRFEKGTPNEEDADAFNPPRPLAPALAAMFRARTAALSLVKTVCGNGLNPVVLPASLAGKDGWLVYILASSNRSQDRVMAGHHLFRVSQDGAEVLEETPLSRSCLIDEVPKDAQPLFEAITHIVSPAPMETHVYTSLLYRLPLYVRTDRGLWKVRGQEITFLGGP